MSRLFPALLVGLLSPLLAAKQLAFYHNGPELHYHWQAPDGQTLHLQTRLPNQTAVNALIDWRPAMVDAAIYPPLLNEAQQRYPEVRFRLLQDKGQWQLTYQIADAAKGAEISQWLAQQRTKHWDDYLSQHYFVQDVDAQGQGVVRYDYVRLVQALQPELAVLATQLQAATEGQQPTDGNADADPRRTLIAWMLNFVQSIPYRPLDVSGGRRGLGFLLPRQVLEQNAGDCDSKMVLMAGLLRAKFPTLPLSLVLVPGHALLAVDLPPQPGEMSLPGAGLLLEVAGPAELAPGQVAEHSRLYIQGGQRQIIPLPAEAAGN